MKAYTVQRVGTDDRGVIDAANEYHAVAEVAGCAVADVTLPIWTRGQDRWGNGGERCYMPRDDSGRQWIVRDYQEPA